MRCLSAIAVLLLSTAIVYSQEPQSKFVPAEIKLTTRLSQLVFLNFNITAEKRMNARQTLGLTLEYRPGGKKIGMADGMFGPMGAPYYLPHFNRLYNGATIAINSKFYFIKGRSFYIDAVGFYRRWWFNRKYVDYDMVEPPGLDIAATRSERMDVYGFKALFGRSFVRRTRSMTWVLDIYAGIGVRNKQRISESYNGIVNEQYYGYKIERYAGWMPSIQGGFQLGIGK